MIRLLLVLACTFSVGCAHTRSANKGGTVVLTTDFGVKDGAVSAMKGVAHNVDKNLFIGDVTHEITPYSIWDAAYRLEQTAPYWPEGTVFVTVVDPGVGSDRKAIAALRQDGSIFIGPDNGHLTLLEDAQAFQEVRVIDESKHRRQGSEESYTFHGRDLFVYAGALLASGKVAFKNIGPQLKSALVRLTYQKAAIEKNKIEGTIVVLDPNYGNVWTNIPKSFITQLGTPSKLKIEIRHKNKRVYQGELPLANTFAEVASGKALTYFNSLLNLSLALNMDSFAKKYSIGSGPEWSITVSGSPTGR